MKIDRFDHLVLTVTDVEATCRFYARVLDMEEVRFGAGRRALRFGAHKINLHPATGPFTPHARQPTPGSADLCLITSTPLTQAMAQVKNEGVEIIEGPVQRSGATGAILSFYFRDPDGNLIEVSNYQELVRT